MEINILEQIGAELKRVKNILITAHIRPDGDAIGSVLGLGLSLEAYGKTIQMVLAERIPESFRFLAGCEKIIKHPKELYDLVVVLDCGDTNRIGNFLQGKQPDINIDHHLTNDGYAKINYVDPNAVSTTEIIATNLPKWGFPIPEAAASAFLAGILTDTIGYRTPNVHSGTMILTAQLMDKGANLSQLYEKTLTNRSYEAARFWGHGLMNLERQDGMIWTTLTIEERNKSSYRGKDDADLVNLLATIEDCDIAIVFGEQKNGFVKVSWRARHGLDVSNIALKFGGGGHPAASGADIKGQLDQVQNEVLNLTSKYLQNIVNT